MVDINTQFGGFLTALGAAQDANSKALGIPWKLTHMLIGDALGADPVPAPGQTALVNQVYRAQLNQLYVSPTDANVLIAELVLPPNVGGWWIRELALEDEDGVFSAVANCAPSYKPVLAQGSGRNQVVRMHVITSGTANIQLKIDPSVVLATRAYCDGLIAAHAAAANPHPQYIDEADLNAAIAAIITVPTGYLTGFTLRNNAGTPSAHVDIAPGLAKSASTSASIQLLEGMTKRLQSAGAWAQGNDANGLFSGARAPNTWYHAFVIRKDSDGSVDIGFDTSLSAANRPAGWTAYRRLGSVKTNSGAEIIPFLQAGRFFFWKTPILDVSVNAAAGSSASYVLSVPTGIEVIVQATLYFSGGDAAGYLHHPDSTDIVVHYLPGSYLGGTVGTTNAANEYFASEVNVLSNHAAQVRYTALATAANDMRIATLGWLEP